MASTPSASALSAVLRCRGNILARNPPTKRPSGAVYSLGLAGGGLRDSSAERTGANRASAGRRAAVVLLWDKERHEMSREEDYSRKNNQLHHRKLSQPAGNPTPHAGPPAQNTLARGLRSALLGGEKCSKIIHVVNYKSLAARVCERISIRAAVTLPRGVLRLCVTSARPTENPPSWSKATESCLSLTFLLSKALFLKLCGPSGPTSCDAQLLRAQDVSDVQTNGDVSSRDMSCGQEGARDGPD